MRTVLLVFLFFTHIYAADEYQLGDGIQVGELPLYVGGYFSVDYQKTDTSTRYRIDDIALLIYGGINKFSYIAELEFKEFYLRTYTNTTSTITTNDKLYIERLYFDYNYDENILLRLGKYNSPIGFWNLLPVNVLRETTSNPVSTFVLFPKFTTGIYASYTRFDEEELQVDVIVQNNANLSNAYNNFDVTEHYGLGFSYTLDDYIFKMNAGHYKKNTQSYYNYALASMKYDTDKYQIMTEMGLQNRDQSNIRSYAGYIQGLYRFTPKHLGILRLESYDDKSTNTKDSFAVMGYTYRPVYPVALKAEYQAHSLTSQNQVLFSVSVLF
ncbi:hypothetical protein JHD48_09420 [Sulfurimonas sp. SAG-AH-194-I05]|nr:hypothetical protein [Sulfurimonas sp. SAG-AH-194-I05]MDF1875953.1 hypothetical protein [Sulfurimonas sp. SAG-AH-194-I05]